MAEQQSALFSKSISDFLTMLEETKKAYAWHYDEVNRLDLLTQDYLHKLELEDLSYHERAKVATEISLCRKQRRESKDIVGVLRPIIEFLESDKGKNLLNLMREVLGKTRKAEEYLGNRTYIPRVLDK